MFAEIAVFAESPNSHYEQIVCSPISITSSVNTQLTVSASSLPSRRGRIIPRDNHQVSKRALPPIPSEFEDAVQQKSKRRPRWSKKHGNTHTGCTIWYYPVEENRNQSLTRTGSESSLRGKENGKPKPSTSRSLELLNTEDPQKEKKKKCSKFAHNTVLPNKLTSSGYCHMVKKPRLRPRLPLPTVSIAPQFTADTVTSPDGEIADAGVPQSSPSAPSEGGSLNAKELKRNSTLQRQITITPGMRRHCGTYRSHSQPDYTPTCQRNTSKNLTVSQPSIEAEPTKQWKRRNTPKYLTQQVRYDCDLTYTDIISKFSKLYAGYNRLGWKNDSSRNNRLRGIRHFVFLYNVTDYSYTQSLLVP